MITINVTPDDLVKMRFAYRPLLEIPLSYRVLTNPAFQAPYQRWLEEANRSLYDANLPYLAALVVPAGYIPDFLTPTPIANRVKIEDDFADLLATPDALIQKNIQELIDGQGDSEIRRFFLVHPREAVEYLVEDLRAYWERVLAHYWSRMISVLEGDVLYHGRMLALDGPGKLFEDLHPSISYHADHINLAPCCQFVNTDANMSLSGDGIQLTPLVFGGCGRMFQVTPEMHPMLAYRVRGSGLWYDKRPSQSLELALGTQRARVLQGLRTPASNSELAIRLRLTSGAISQHLNRLHRAGLVKPHRSGKRVYYHLTPRGEDLIALFERID